jgi:ATP-dependent exoDNAse (exonuclease V) beta subunit
VSNATFTDEQEQAAGRRSGPLLLSAGAGSGKTSVLVERFVRAVREDGIAPARILAITFTERAAGELRERVRARLLALGEREAAREAEEAFIVTFHGFCLRLLRSHPLPARIEPGFRVLDEGLASRLQRLAFGDALRSFLDGEPADSVDLVAAYGADGLQRMAIDAYAQLRSQGQTQPRLPAATVTDGQAALACRLIDELLGRFGDAYIERKRARLALDFDDLELAARDLLRDHEHIRAAWSERFEMLMVDEFQDTNARQLELLRLLDRENLFTVGDELQSIYGFRHADVRLFRERRSRLAEQGDALALTRNFRSRPEILAAVERVFGARLGEAYTPLAAAREAPAPGEPAVELLLTDCRGWKDAQDAAEHDIRQLLDATPWRLAEARALAARVAELVHGGEVQAADVVVLLRALGDLPVYEAALRAAGLSTLAAAGGFWGHRQVGDLIAYLRALCNPLDELALYGTLASPLVGISSDGLALLSRAARERREGVWQSIERADEALDAVLGPSDRGRLDRFREWFANERDAAASHPLAELIRRAISWSGYDARVLSLRWGERRLANVRKLLAIARTFEAQEGRDLRAFLDHAAHLGDFLGAREADAPAGEEGLDAVRLMSIHSAKGLEFPVVCVADLGRAPKLSVGDLLVERDGRIGLRLARLGEPELAPALHFEELRAQSQQAQQEEEDRILYVAMTRARDRLLLSGAADLARWPAPKQGGAPIAWLAPALIPDLESTLQAGGRDMTIEAQVGLSVRCQVNRPSGEAGMAGQVVASTCVPGQAAASRCVAAPTAVQACAAGPAAHANRPLRLRPASSPAARLDASEQSPLSHPDTTVSYSSLAELERCGYRYYLERVLRMGERASAMRQSEGGVEARTRGVIVHELLERTDFCDTRPPTSADVAAAASRLRARISRSEREAIAGLVAGALDTPLARRIAQGRGARREHPFTFSLGREQPLVTGVLDLLVHEPDGSALIVDYKSDRVNADEDLDALVRSEYGLQRLLYALAAIEAGAGRVHVAHWFLERPHEPVFESFEADERPILRTELLERMARLREKGFAVAEVPHRGICATCPGRGTLCSWGQTHTSRELSTPLESPQRAATLTS